MLFASLSVLFAACLVAYFVTRAQSPLWRTANWASRERTAASLTAGSPSTSASRQKRNSSGK